MYTSYFSIYKMLIQSGLCPIAISRSVPPWYDGLCYKKLAPSYEVFSNYKRNNDTDIFTRDYELVTLSKLMPANVLQEIVDIIPIGFTIHDVVFLCWEPIGFCHRYLVSKWFVSNGFSCEEWSGVL